MRSIAVAGMWALLGLAACASATTGVAANGVDAGRDAQGGGRAPAKHRAQGDTCAPAPLPPEPVIPDAGLGPSAMFECRTHGDCLARPRGRCIFEQTSPPRQPGGTRCVYDECTTDSECAAGATCSCGTVANVCVQGNCRLDTDCGTNGWCSPGVDGCGGFNGYYCHTAADQCLDDSDCTGGLSFVCHPDSTTHAWACGPVGCG